MQSLPTLTVVLCTSVCQSIDSRKQTHARRSQHSLLSLIAPCISTSVL